MRQLGNCKPTIPESWVIVAHFYDVESGRMELTHRGRGSDYERFDIPIARDGGITDLLAESTRQDRRFDVVICESISRVARRAFEGLSIERALEQSEVPLFASNEPITLAGSRAQRILQRRINQSVAEYEVLNTLEQSWGGLCTHVREGWNIGKPPYGYRAKIFRHPNPTKAAKGQTKSRLEPDGAGAETVTQIATWRHYEKLGYSAIADRLNADLDKYPSPVPPDPSRARGAWGRSSIYEILRNPKYTGYQVFNRRASRSRHGKVNDSMKWVWSPEPAHEPLIPKWMYDEINNHAQDNKGVRAQQDKTTRPITHHRYVLRSMIFCSCGRRLYGCQRSSGSYYLCTPKKNNRGRPDTFSDHPKTIYMREKPVLDAVARFFAERVFGPDRRTMLQAEVSSIDDRAASDRAAEQGRLERQLADIERRQEATLRQAIDGDPNDPFTKALRTTYNDLEKAKQRCLSALTALGEKAPPATMRGATPDLLDALPYLALNLARAPQALLRRLFEATQLSIQLNDKADQAMITIRLPADQVATVAATAGQLAVSADEPAGQHGVDAVCAPDGVRTRTGSILSRLPLPVGLRGHRTA